MNLLDGRNFIGIVLERGKTEGDADTIMFRAGRFRSSACDRYEYGDGPYSPLPYPRVLSGYAPSERA